MRWRSRLKRTPRASNGVAKTVWRTGDFVVPVTKWYGQRYIQSALACGVSAWQRLVVVLARALGTVSGVAVPGWLRSFCWPGAWRWLLVVVSGAELSLLSGAVLSLVSGGVLPRHFWV